MSFVGTSSNLRAKEVNCCLCNRSATCKNCVCVRAGHSCRKCLPGSLGKCLNQPLHDSGQPRPTRSPPTSPTSTTAVYSVPTTSLTTPSSHILPHVSSDITAPQLSDPLPNLPPFRPMADPRFVWGESDSSALCSSIKETYDEVVHWRRDCFQVPRGDAGKSFVAEMARLYDAFSSGSALESVALMATSILPILLLQQPHTRSQTKDHIRCLERRLKAWKDGDLAALVKEGRTIQQRFPKTRPQNVENENRLARRFANLMFQGKTHAALDLLANCGKGGVLRLDQPANPNDPDSKTVREALASKHPTSHPASPDSSLLGPPPEVHPVVFDSIDAGLIRSTALRTSGAAGPSGLDAHAWRRMCTAFKAASKSLCQSLADVAKRLCSSLVDPEGLGPLLACRLIALDKCPGVRPIGIGETARCIITKAVLVVVRGDVLDAAGSIQLCAGQLSGCEAAVHSVREAFLEDDTEAALLVDASNAFNSINRMAALHNIRHLCPSIANILINCYRAPTSLFIEGDTLLSQEGTTQGDPLGMPMYALATVSLIKKLPTTVKQTWYADDAAGTGKIANLRGWWDEIVRLGPSFGYHPNASKTWLVIKKEHESAAVALFGDTDVKITSEGRPHLGAPLGSPEYVSSFISEKIQLWAKELKLLSAIATTQPHAAYAAYTHGLTGKWLHLARTVPSISSHLKVLDDILTTVFIPNLTGRPPPNEVDRRLLALPARLGGLGVSMLSSTSDDNFVASMSVTAPLRQLIHHQDNQYSYETSSDQMSAKADIQRRRREQAITNANHLRNELTPTLQRAMDLARERGSSSWLTARPLEEHDFSLHKGAFVDALALRYW